MTVAGFQLSYRTMITGAWSASDSLTYFAVAENIAEDKGVTAAFARENNLLTPNEQVALGDRQPLVYWPPGYPVMLAAGSWFGIGVADTASLVAALALAVVGGAMAWLVVRRTGSIIGAVLAPAVFAVNFSVLAIYTSISSDGPYTAVTMAALCFGVAHLRRPALWKLAAFIALVDIAVLVRFVGIAAIPVVAVVVLLSLRGPRWRRTLLAVAAAGLTAVPFLVSRSQTRSVAGYSPPGSYRSRWADVPQWWTEAQGWLVPRPDLTGGWITVAGTAIVVGLGLAVLARALPRRNAAPADPGLDPRTDPGLDPDNDPGLDPGNGSRWFRARDERWGDLVIALFPVIYLGTVLYSAMVLDHTNPFDSRLLMPAIPAVIVLITTGVVLLLGRIPWRIVRGAVAVLVSAAALASINAHVRFDNDRVWAPGLLQGWNPGAAPQLPGLRDLAPDTVVFSNQPGPVWAVTGHTVYVLPQKRIPIASADNPRHDQSVSELRELARQRPMVIVLGLGDLAMPQAVATINAAFPTEVLSETAVYRVLRPVVTPAS